MQQVLPAYVDFLSLIQPKTFIFSTFEFYHNLN